jgi:hypothetical protein
MQKIENVPHKNVYLLSPKEDIMDLKEYFNDTKGVGVLATSDADGKVDAAIYARPHFMEDGKANGCL